MPDWETLSFDPGALAFSTAGRSCMAGQWLRVVLGSASGSAVWPTANTAIFVPIQIEIPCTIYQMAFNVITQSGNYDIGIYNEQGTRLSSKGSTAVPVAGIALADIADVAVNPGTYYLALNIDNVTASVTKLLAPTNAEMLRAMGIRSQAVGAVTLPATATFANPASTYIPTMTAIASPGLV